MREELRQQVLERANFRCERCWTTEKKLETHHVIARRYKGSTDSLDNLICLCRKCHKIIEPSRKMKTVNNPLYRLFRVNELRVKIPRNLLLMFKHFAIDDDIKFKDLIVKVIIEYASKRLGKK
jgi:predicted restriction endonuclease